ncbi:MAG: flagellar motor protein MotD [marine bacterium B5-7]|nr:MAG: flagellar motor protein MotD [marine bacterium B5-7]
MRRNTHNQEEEVNHDRWLISYADFITLMFAFFVVMYSISSVSEGKYRVLSDALNQAFDSNQKTTTPIPNPIDLPIAQSLPYEQAEGTIEAESVEGIKEEIFAENDEQAEDLAKPGTEQDRIKKSLGEIADDIRYEVLPFIDEQLISVNNTDKTIEVEIKSQLLFPSGNARLVSKAIPVLSNLATIFSTFNNPIQVEGFTDNQPIRTTAFPSNWELSAARAASVVHLFMRKGIAPTRMSAIGFAEFHPIADNNTEAGRQENRRVLIVIPTVPDDREEL